jgi:HEAT repeat protein
VEVRRTVVEFLFTTVHGADKSLVNANDILPMLSDTDESIRWQGVCIMLQVAGKPAMKHLIPMLKDSDAQIRGNVARLLIGLEDKSLIPKVLPLLEDADKYVRLAAIESLAYLGDDELIEKYALMDKLVSIAKGRDKRLKFQAIEVAVRIGQGDALEKYGLIDELVNLIDDGDEWLMTRSITIAGKYGPPSIIKKILPFLKNKDLRIKLSAAWALTQQDDIRAVPVWIEHIDDECNVAILHDNRLADTGLTSIIYVADEPLRKLTGQTFNERRESKLWKDWWAKEGKTWYEEEVKKIKDE